MKRYPIEVGSILFTMVEPHRGREVEYNRWYERDHFYAGCMIGPGNFAGRRYVARRAEKESRPTGANPITPDPMTGSYLAIYWILSGMHDEWNTWAVEQVNRLHASGRMFPDRDHIHTLLYRTSWDVERDDAGVSLALALDHPCRGLVATFADATSDRDALSEWYRDDFLPTVMPSSPIAVCGGFTPLPLLVDAPGDVPRAPADDQRLMVLWFLDDEPATVWHDIFAKHAGALEESGAGRLVWASPFIPTIPGSDTYTDQLW
jgi:hypothetical protein